MGLLSGRSRRTSRKVRQERQPTESSPSSSHKPRKPEGKEDGEAVEVPKPDLEELRRRRAEYYAIPAATRRRVSSASTVKTPSRRSNSTSLHTSREKPSKQQPRRKRSSRSKKSETTIDESQSRTEDYVYGPRISPKSSENAREAVRDKEQRVPSTKRTSKHSSSSKRRSLPTVLETEVTPNDSISQVGARDVSEKDERSASARSSVRRSRTTSNLPSVSERSEDPVSVAASKRSTKKQSSSYGAFGRRHSTPSLPSPPRLVECLTCGSDEVPSTQSAKLSCGHRMCHECLRRIFEMSVKDPQHMPPKCCKDEHIPLKHVDKLFDVRFKMLWNRKYQEYHTKNRIYCPAPKCGEWIKPSHIHTDQGRKYASCPRCKTKVCVLCNNKFHKSSDCPKDPEIAKLVEQAKEKGWQRCYSCNALVERHEGCNHMTCRCSAQFCILCGAKWKTCECPWFNYSHLPDPNRLDNLGVPEPIQVLYRQVFGRPPNHPHHAPPPPPPPPPAGNAAPLDRRGTAARRGPLPEVTYQQELDQRRRQERLDADLARRLQLASIMEPDEGDAVRHRADTEGWGLGNTTGNFINDDFVQNAANVIMNTFGDTNLGRRGERASGRRRRNPQTDHRDRDMGLVPDFLGDESVLGV